MTNPPATVADNRHTAPLHSDIAQCATELWIEYGRPEGRDVEIWLEAERRLLSATTHRKDAEVRTPPAPQKTAGRARPSNWRSQPNVGPPTPPSVPPRPLT